jgi:hypothetical protein
VSTTVPGEIGHLILESYFETTFDTSKKSCILIVMFTASERRRLTRKDVSTPVRLISITMVFSKQAGMMPLLHNNKCDPWKIALL